MTEAILEAAHANYTKGLQSVIDAMRQCTEYAEIYMAVLNNPESAPHAVNGTLKRKRGKGKDADEEASGKRKRVKDPNAPKRPASSYIIFQNDARQGVKESHPNASPAELRTLISQAWAQLGDEEKGRFKDKAEAAKVKYTAEKAAYAARSPEEVAAAAVAADTAKEKPKRGKYTPKKFKTAEKVVSRESTAEPEPVLVQQQTSSIAASDDSSEDSGSSEEEEDENEDEDEDEEEPAPKKTKVPGKHILKEIGKKSK